MRPGQSSLLWSHWENNQLVMATCSSAHGDADNQIHVLSHAPCLPLQEDGHSLQLHASLEHTSRRAGGSCNEGRFKCRQECEW